MRDMQRSAEMILCLRLTVAAMSGGGIRSCVCIPRAEFIARRNVEHDTNPAIAYEPLLAGRYFLMLCQFISQVSRQV